MRANHFRQERVLSTDQRYQKHMFPALYHISKSSDVGEMKNSPIPVSDTGSLGMADNTTQIEVAKSPCGESHAFHLKHITPGSQQASMFTGALAVLRWTSCYAYSPVHRRSRVRSCLLPCGQWSRKREKIIIPRTDTDVMNFETRRTGPWQL